MTVFDSRRFFLQRSAIDAAQIYGMVGGIPLYLSQFGEAGNLARDVQQVLFDPSSILYEEPLNLLKQEVKKPRAATQR